MVKSSNETIEKDIQSVLYELQKNSRKSVNDIALKLGFSRQKTWRLIKDLENDKTIWGYTAIVDDNKISQKRFFITLKKAQVPVKDEKLNLIIDREFSKLATKYGAFFSPLLQ